MPTVMATRHPRMVGRRPILSATPPSSTEPTAMPTNSIERTQPSVALSSPQSFAIPGEAKLMDRTSNPSMAFRPTVTRTASHWPALIAPRSMTDFGSLPCILFQREVALIFRIVDEVVERSRIPQRGAIGCLVRIHPHENSPHGHLELLACERVGYIQHLINLVRHVARRIIATQLFSHAPGERFIKQPLVPQLDEQRHEKFTARQIQIDDQRIVDLHKLRERSVDFRRADADAVPVEGGIRPTQHIHTAAPIEANEIPVAPDARIDLEVTLAVAPVLRIVPELHGHRRHRLCDDKLAHFIDDLPALLVESKSGAPQRARLDLTRVHRQQRHPTHEPRAAIGASASGRHP